MKHRTCPDCGAALDPCEICDCQTKNEGEPAGTDSPSSGNDCGRDSFLSISDPYREVNNLLCMKDLREQSGAMAKDVALAIRARFPKFNRQLLSQCEQWDKYGVIIHPDGLEILCVTCGIKLPTNARPEISITVDGAPAKKKENRKLGRRVAFRVTNSDFEVLLKRVQEDGYGSIQAWLYAKIMELLGGVTSADPS